LTYDGFLARKSSTQNTLTTLACICKGDLMWWFESCQALAVV
jgi:hypothetical protein